MMNTTSKSKSGGISVFRYELLLLLVSITWGSAFVAQQIGMEEGLGQMTFTGLCFAIGCISVFCQQHWPPAPSAIIMSLEVGFAAVAGYLVLHQTLTGRAIIGCLLILAHDLLVQLAPMMRRVQIPSRDKQKS